jgi:thymidylate synthase (FAD)
MMHLWIIELVVLKFQAKGKVIIQKLIKGENVDVDSSGLSKREWNELMLAFDLKDKLI